MLDIEKYDYALPKDLIAREPAVPRDHSRLFVYSIAENKITFDIFANLDKYIPRKSFLVLNQTKVAPARATLKKDTGGKIEILFLVNEFKKGDKTIRGLSDRKISPKQKIHFDSQYALEAVKFDNKAFVFKPNFPPNKIFSLLEKYGAAPMPPYIKNIPLSKQELKKKYQTVFAQNIGSAAAPTAALHFTKKVFQRLENKNIKRFFITLHIGLGTFAPLTQEQIKRNKLFAEYFEMERSTARDINKLKKLGYRLIAVGTTTTRALESAGNKGKILSPKGWTDIFISPPYDFQMTDALITNFHLPKSSLMMLADAFLKSRNSKKSAGDLYEIAIENKFRFYSFGDAMLII